MRQGSLFDILPTEERHTIGLAGVIPAIKAAMGYVAAQDVEGRKTLADRITNIASRERVALTAGGGKTLSDDVLVKLLQPKDTKHDPTIMELLCFCLATGSAKPLKPALDVLGLTIISKDELKFLEYGKSCIAMKKAKEKKNKLENQL